MNAIRLIIIIGCACVSVALYFSYIGVTKSETTPIPKFQKVDSYNGCSVIQYTPENRTTSQFFLNFARGIQILLT
jgi:hypothetical protein